MSGLFGGKPSPFAASTTPATTGSSLFGSTTPAQPSQNTANPLGQTPKPGGLFGGLGSTTNQQPSHSPFANTTTQPQAGASVFGSALAGQNQPTNPSPFGSLGLSTNNQATPGLFAASQQQSTGNATNAQSQGPTTGYFDSLLAKSKKQAAGETALEDLPSLQLGLGDLRQKLRNLGPRAQDPLQSNRAQYMLAASGVDPGAAVKDLNYFDIQAGRVERPTSNAGPSELDVDTYLANLQTKTTLSMIAEGLERSAKEFDNFLEDNITMEWDAQRKRIYEHFGIQTRDSGPDNNAGAPKESVGGFGRSRRTKAARSTPTGERASTFCKIGSHQPEFTDVENQSGKKPAMGGAASVDDRFLREKQGKLADKIRELNRHRLEQRPYPLLHELSDVESRSGDRHAQQVVEAYQAVISIVATPHKPWRYARGFSKGANGFLENKFFTEVETLITKYPREANLGGRPDVVSKIKAYVRLRHARRDLVPDNTELQQVGGEYIWALIYYLLRSGHVTEAAEYVKAHSTIFRTIDRTFSSYLLEYASNEDRRLRRQLQERCNNEYTQRARNAPENSIDPFRMACYKIIGRCEINNRQLEGLNTEINDWIWLQFNLARESDKTGDLQSESFTLIDLQQTIREIGAKHFPKTPAEDSNGTFGMYFFLQVLSGQFEQAIQYLYPFSYVDAVHFAIGLGFYGLLRPADPFANPNDLVTFNTRNQAQVSFGRMLGYYTRDFRAADVASAVDYLALMCLNADLDGDAGSQQAELCHLALRELILETREFSKLIGDIRPDGRRIVGLVEERGPLIGLREEDDFVKAVTLQAARYADDNGRTTDAVLLYHLAEDYDSVVTIVSRALSEAISLDIGEDPLRLQPVKSRAGGREDEVQPGSSLSLASIDDPVDLARTMMGMYEKDAMFYTKIEEHNRIACHLLLQMSEIKGMVESGQWSESLDRIRVLEILPLDANGDPAIIRHYASKFSGLSQSVSMNVPNLLMWTLACCMRQKERLMSGQYSGNEGARRTMFMNLKQMTMDLTTYTSQLKYRFPPHIHQALARASAD
ncbi:Nup93/Nic96-domain-containing protein [Apiospora hydei]|uniref:Nup93/Nic96-domain-containing protein n=1 Tax=Apiospora hydei TaxID=1337664 RepID=A0ABR1XCS9_9PEZI